MEEKFNFRNNEDMEIDLAEVFRVLMRRWWLIVLCLILGAGAAGVVTHFLITPQYEASSMLYILTKTTSVTSLADIQMGTQLTADFEVIATSRPVIEDAAKDVEEETKVSYTYEQLKTFITVSNQADTRILKITATHEDPQLAMVIANAVSKETASHMAEIMTTDAPTTVESAVIPENPVSPSLPKNCAIGGLLGAFVVMALLLIQYLMDDTIKTEEDVAKYLGLDTLVSLPLESKSERKSRKRAKRRKKKK